MSENGNNRYNLDEFDDYDNRDRRRSVERVNPNQTRYNRNQTHKNNSRKKSAVSSTAVVIAVALLLTTILAVTGVSVINNGTSKKNTPAATQAVTEKKTESSTVAPATAAVQEAASQETSAPAETTVEPASAPAGEIYSEGVRTNLDRKKPMVALTFDDGPNGECTQSIIDTLAKYDARATFFMVGKMVEEEPEMVKKVAAGGNEVANHSYDHIYADTLTVDQQKFEIDKTNELIKNLTGKSPRLFRCPGGIQCDYYLNSGMPMVQWSVDTRDWEHKTTSMTIDSVIKVVENGQNLDGDIVLMHDLQESTPAAVSEICSYLHKHGYQMVTVSELAYYRDVAMEGGKTYMSMYPGQAPDLLQ